MLRLTLVFFGLGGGRLQEHFSYEKKIYILIQKKVKVFDFYDIRISKLIILVYNCRSFNIL